MKKLFIILSILWTLCSCSKSEEPKSPEPPKSTSISLNTSSATVLNTASTAEVIITSSDSWTLSGDIPWCKPSVKSGKSGDKVVFTIDENTSPDDRNVTYSFTCGDKTASYVITQKQKDALTITKAKYDVKAEGETIEVEVKANISFTVEVKNSWIKQISTKGIVSTKLSFIIEASEELSQREGEIIIKNGNTTESIKVFQSQKNSLVITQKEYNIPADGEIITIELKSNIDFEVVMPNVTWLREVQTKGLSTHTKYYQVDKNESSEIRNADIIFKSKIDNLIETVKISQAYTETVIIHLATAGTLNSLMTDEAKKCTKKLVISGFLDDSDFYTINMQMPSLKLLDMQNVTLDEIPNTAFKSNTSINTIILPSNLKNIKSEAFNGCTSLTNITIPNGVSSIEFSAFEKCKSLTNITIPESVTSIGIYAFCDCSSLTNIIIPESVTSIGIYAFSGCYSLTSITIPNGVTRIEEGIFGGCLSLTSITIPNGVTHIGDNVFSGCTSLTNITIPNGVTWIGDKVFRDCTSLTNFTIPNSVAYIGSYAFSGCTSLTNITIPNSLQQIEYGTFSDCTSLTSATIPNSVTWIEYDAFWNCKSLKLVICKNPRPPLIRTSSFIRISDAELRVPISSILTYKTTEWGKKFSNITGINE